MPRGNGKIKLMSSFFVANFPKLQQIFNANLYFFISFILPLLAVEFIKNAKFRINLSKKNHFRNFLREMHVIVFSMYKLKFYKIVKFYLFTNKLWTTKTIRHNKNKRKRCTLTKIWSSSPIPKFILHLEKSKIRQNLRHLNFHSELPHERQNRRSSFPSKWPKWTVMVSKPLKDPTIFQPTNSIIRRILNGK